MGAPEWEGPSSGGGAPSGAAGGDLAGTYPNPTVDEVNSTLAGPTFVNSDGYGFTITKSGASVVITPVGSGSNKLQLNGVSKDITCGYWTSNSGTGAWETFNDAYPLSWPSFSIAGGIITGSTRFWNRTTAQKNAIGSPAAGMVIFDTTLGKLCVYSGAGWETITSI